MSGTGSAVPTPVISTPAIPTQGEIPRVPKGKLPESQTAWEKEINRWDLKKQHIIGYKDAHSGSKIEYEQYLLLRIAMLPPKPADRIEEQCFKNGTPLNSATVREARDLLDGCSSWVEFISSIKKNEYPPKEHAAFTITRDQQVIAAGQVPPYLKDAAEPKNPGDKKKVLP